MTDDNAARARESISAFNSSDWEAICGMAGHPYRYEETGTNRGFDGVEETIAALIQWKTAFPDGTGHIEQLLSDGDTVAMEIRWRGTHSGPLSTPDGDVPATGRDIEVWAAMWQRWEGGRLLHERHHIDLLTMLTQLGVVPAPASR